MAIQTAELSVSGMTCDHCVTRVENALRAVKGVVVASVELSAGRADVEYDDARTDRQALASAVRDAGYDPSGD